MSLDEHIGKTYLASDLHFDHKNIISFCNRPFKNTDEMNEALTANWNSRVSDDDTVYLLGDVTYGKGHRSLDSWVSQLNGEIVLIKGNHDRSKRIKMKKSLVMEYRGEQFYLVHDPKNVPRSWGSWVICGHHHNIHPENHPFINGETKQINVSMENIDYSPLNLDSLFMISFQRIEYMRTLMDAPIYFTS